MEDEHFIVWMRYAGLPTFRKLWGRITKAEVKKDKTPLAADDFMDLKKGKYTIDITNN